MGRLSIAELNNMSSNYSETFEEFKKTVTYLHNKMIRLEDRCAKVGDPLLNKSDYLAYDTLRDLYYEIYCLLCDLDLFFDYTNKFRSCLGSGSMLTDVRYYQSFIHVTYNRLRNKMNMYYKKYVSLYSRLEEYYDG